jgi:DNA-binding MarR family transcriptional regulator
MDHALKILDLLIKMQERSDLFGHKWDGLLDGISLGEVHCIDYIGRIDHPNVTKISESMGLTRAGISKISKKLMGKGMIESYQDSDNKKEIYFRLTQSGQLVYDKHKIIHNKARKEWLTVFENYSHEEQTAIFRFLTDISHLLERESADRIEREE